VVERSIARKVRELGLDPSEVKVENYYHHKFVGVQIALGNASTQLLMEGNDLQPKPHSEVLDDAGDLLNQLSYQT
jgi:hypothetical protein